MQKSLRAAIFLLFIITSCGTNKTVPSNTPIAVINTVAPLDTKTPEPSSTATSTTFPSPIPASPTSTPEIFFFDEFNNTLQPGWKWVNENKNNWSLNTEPGFLQMIVKGGYPAFYNESNLLLRPAPKGDFELKTLLYFFPKASNQFAGLILLETNENYIQIGYSYSDPINGSVGRGLYTDVYKAGKLQLPRMAADYEGDQVYFQIAKRGNLLDIAVSSDARLWYQLTGASVDFEIRQVGIFTGQNLEEYDINSAKFDYFTINLLR